MGERSNLGNLGGGGGEIVEVEGGHIIRSIGRKDRHSKVCTARGPRDRRVRLAAHTAIQFYDVQDRLGYDRPSKAVDWLIKNAKAAIDELPLSKPTTAISADVLGPSSRKEMAMLDYNVNEASSSSMQFQAYPAPDFLSKSSTYSQDLRLSLQSFRDPVQAQVFLGTPSSFDSFQDHHPQSLGSWNPGEDSIGGSGVAAAAAGYMLNPPTGSQQLLGQHQFFSQRGTLQSSNTPSVRTWVDASVIPIADADLNTRLQLQHSPIWPMYPSSMSSIGFASGVGGFSEFHIPSRIQGDQERQVGYPNNPSSSYPRHQV